MPTLNWIGKDAVVNHHLQVPFHLLRDVPELGCGEPGEGNLIVEGDNLTALKALLPYYAGQVKCIYIDPPYNTGNEGWVYNDNVKSPLITEWLGKVVGKEGETLDRHDRWLCMMYPRLALLRQFLRQDGAIFVSIDDNEVGFLRVLMDEIFGRDNFIANIVWQKKYTIANDAKWLAENHDHILLYARRKEIWRPARLARSEEMDRRYRNPDNHPKGPWKATPLYAKRTPSAAERAFSFTFKNGYVWTPPPGTTPRFPKETLREMDENDEIWFGAKGDAAPSRKTFLTELKIESPPAATIWLHSDAGHNHEARDEIKALVGADSFDTPKPTRLIERILQIATNPGDLILDSFAGSGTTGHAVLKLNAANVPGRVGVSPAVPGVPPGTSNVDNAPPGDTTELFPENENNATSEGPRETRGPAGGTPTLPGNPPRRFILVEIEPKIAREVTAERVRRVAEGYTNAKGGSVERIGGGFRYCTLGETLFDEAGKIRESVRFGELARHVYFTETGEPLVEDRKADTGNRKEKSRERESFPVSGFRSPLLGVCRGVAIYLLYKGILGDKSANGGNVLTRATLAQLPPFDGPKVVYCAGCLLGRDRLAAGQIVVRQTPYEIKVT